MKSKAVIFGTGRIGCGFIGYILKCMGYDIVFVARNQSMIDYLNCVGKYRIRMVAPQNDLFRFKTFHKYREYVSEDIQIDGVSAISVHDLPSVTRAIAASDLIATAVGQSNLEAVASVITHGLAQTKHPVQVLAFENALNSARILQQATQLYDPPVYSHSFTNVLVEHVVTGTSINNTAADTLCFIGEAFDRWIVDGRTLRYSLPSSPTMMITDTFDAWFDRKLYIYSAGHAVAAYLGYLKGYQYIHSAIYDTEIQTAVLTAMREGQMGIAARYGDDIAGTTGDLLRVIQRFANAVLNDPILRVGRDPWRKLRFDDRLIGAARLAEAAGVRPNMLILAAAAAICFASQYAKPTIDLLSTNCYITALDIVRQICGIDVATGIGQQIMEQLEHLARGWQNRNLLISLNRLEWA